MKTKLLLTLPLIAMMAAGAFAAAPKGSRGPARPQPPERKYRSGAYVIDAISDFAVRLRVGQAQRHEGLTLYPVFASPLKAPDVDLTLDKAMDLGLVEIVELTSAEVNRVRLHNRAKRPVFIMAGEMLKGAKQDRIVGDDLIVPAGEEVTIPVYCVEHGRWVAKSEAFKSARTLAAPALRQSAKAGQSAVWSRVAAEQDRLRAPSATGALSSVHESAEVQRKMTPYTRAFSDLPDDYPKACGVVAVIGGEIMAADLFSSPAVFRQLWRKLLDSYAIDALERPAAPVRRHARRHFGEGGEPDPADIKDWLEGMRQADRDPKDTAGAGSLYELRGRRVFGSALVWRDGVMHIGLFPARPERITGSDFNSLDFRRERLEGGR